MQSGIAKHSGLPTTLCAPRVLKAHCARNASGELDARTSMLQIQPRQFDARRTRTLRWANVVAGQDINLREPRCAPTMLTSTVARRLLEDIARQTAVCLGHGDSPLESVRFCSIAHWGQATARRRRGSGTRRPQLTVKDILGAGARRRARRREMLAAQSTWDSEGGAPGESGRASTSEPRWLTQ